MWAREHRGRRPVEICEDSLIGTNVTLHPRYHAAPSAIALPPGTTSAAATVTAMTVTTEGHTPTRLASGCEPHRRHVHSALPGRRRAPCPVPLPGAPSACRGEQRPAELTAARPPRDEEPADKPERGDRRRHRSRSITHRPHATSAAQIVISVSRMRDHGALSMTRRSCGGLWRCGRWRRTAEHLREVQPFSSIRSPSAPPRSSQVWLKWCRNRCGNTSTRTGGPADDGLVDAAGGHRAPVAHPEPQLRPVGLGVPGADAEVPVEAAGGVMADLDDAGLAALAVDGNLPVP